MDKFKISGTKILEKSKLDFNYLNISLTKMRHMHQVVYGQMKIKQ